MSTKIPLKCFFLFVIIGFLIYFNSLGNEFIFDDSHLILENVFIRSFKYLPFYFKGYLSSYIQAPKMFRPILMLSFNINYFFHNYNVIGYRLFNIFIHILNVYLLYRLLSLLFPSLINNIKILVCLIFLVHPINVEAVSYISSRSDLMVTFFILLSFMNFLFWEEKGDKKYAFFSYLLYILALLSKETAISLPVFLFLYLYLKYHFKSLRSYLRFYLPILTLTLLYLYLRDFLYQNIGAPNLSKALWLNILTQAKVSFFYLRLFILPYPLSIDHQALSVINPYDTLGVLALFLIIIILVLIFLRPERLIFITISLSWYFSYLSLKFLARLNFPAMEHHFYLPSIGIYILALPFFERIKSKYFSKLVIIILSLLTMFRNFDWRSQIINYKSILRVNPNSCYGLYHLGLAYMKLGIYQKSLNYLTKVFDCYPDKETTVLVLIQIAEIYRNINKLDKAEELILSVIKLDNRKPEIYHELGLIYYQRGDFDKVEDFFKKELKLSQFIAQTYYNIGMICFQKGDFKNAILYLNKALTYNPNFSDAYFLLGLISEKNSIKDAIGYYLKACQYNPYHLKAHYNLATLLAKNGDIRAKTIFKKALQINPNHASTHYNLGIFYLGINDDNKAIRHLKKARYLGYKIPEQVMKILK